MSIKNRVKQIVRKNELVLPFFDSIFFILQVTFELPLSFFFSFFPINNKKIVINNYRGKGYGDNAKYIVEEILKSKNDYEIVWLLKDSHLSDHGLPKSVRSVRYHGWKAIYELMTAKLWIDNSRFDFLLLKRKEQHYIQTWHGGLGLKKIEGDATYGLRKTYIKRAKRDSQLADLFISNSKHLSDIYRRAFWYEGEILEVGYPKNDIFFLGKRNYRGDLRKKLNLSKNIKILLYAPTFRKGHSTDAYNIDFKRLLTSINTQEQESWVVMARLHPNISNEIFSETFPNYIINASEFSDMQELILGVDALVTDYSSCMFDSALAQIPTFIYASDIASYVDDRGFYFSIYDLPFSVAENTAELAINMLSFCMDDFLKNLDEFYKIVVPYDQGDASEKVFLAIERLMNETL